MWWTVIAHTWAPILPWVGEWWAIVLSVRFMGGSFEEATGSAQKFHIQRKVIHQQNAVYTNLF